MNTNIISFAIDAHSSTNHMYDGKPYSIHLLNVAYYCNKYMDLIPKEDYDDVISACWLHDTIEDTRNTYNDIKKISNERVADIVYALTNEKGKNRSERANDKYYAGIRSTPYAIFVKLCDRLANVSYSLGSKSRMLDVYREENEHFIASLLGEKHNGQYNTMLFDLYDMLSLNYKL